MKKVDLKEISLASDVRGKVFTLYLIVWVILEIMCWFIFRHRNMLSILTGAIVGTEVFLVVFFFTVKYFRYSVEENSAEQMFDKFTKKRRAIGPGNHWVLPTENPAYNNDLRESISAEIDADFPILGGTGGKIKIKASVISAVNFFYNKSELLRSRNIIQFNRSTNDTRKTELENVMKNHIKELCSVTDGRTIQKMSSKELFPEEIFYDFEEEFSMDVQDPLVFDNDFSDDTQKIKESELRTDQIIINMKKLVNAGWETKEATILAPFMDEKLHFDRQIYEIKFSGLEIPPAIEEVVKKFIEKKKKK